MIKSTKTSPTFEKGYEKFAKRLRCTSWF